MVDINNVELEGYIGNVRETQVKDSYVYDLSLATNYYYGNIMETTWHNIKIWNNQKIPELSKGKRLHVKGHIRANNYVDQDGNNRYFNYVYTKAEDVKLVK